MISCRSDVIPAVVVLLGSTVRSLSSAWTSLQEARQYTGEMLDADQSLWKHTDRMTNDEEACVQEVVKNNYFAVRALFWKKKSHTFIHFQCKEKKLHTFLNCLKLCTHYYCKNGY